MGERERDLSTLLLLAWLSLGPVCGASRALGIHASVPRASGLCKRVVAVSAQSVHGVDGGRSVRVSSGELVERNGFSGLAWRALDVQLVALLVEVNVEVVEGDLVLVD